MSNGDYHGGGPCGACKFLRRKCVRGCIFAPYFDSEQGSAHFAAVHKVFGASNASKMLLRIPAHKRLDAVVTLCYEALARLRDPVYGCVAHIFTLQQQAELAYTQARLSTFQRLPLLPNPPRSPSPTTFHPSSELRCRSNVSIIDDPSQSGQTSMELMSFYNTAADHELEGVDLETLAQDFVSRHLSGVKFEPSTSK